MNLHNKYKTGDNNSFTYIYYNNIHEIRRVTRTGRTYERRNGISNKRLDKQMKEDCTQRRYIKNRPQSIAENNKD